jgi:hypothetical protein
MSQVPQAMAPLRGMMTCILGQQGEYRSALGLQIKPMSEVVWMDGRLIMTQPIIKKYQQK